jgi:hypothetical protein
MYNLTNIPHPKSRTELDVRIEGGTVMVVAIDPEDRERNPDKWVRVGDIYIGDHMFDPKLRDTLREVVGRALVSTIERARDVGYRQAQADIRKALNV